MRNLFERLKPEYLKMIEDEEINFPFSAKHLQDKLKSTNHLIDLEYGTVISLLTFLGLFNYTPATLYKLFNND